MHVVAAAHKKEQLKHYSTASKLDRTNDDWAVVCYFYSAFRAVRAAFYNDSRLNSDSAAREINTKLTASSRHVDFHNGHPSRGPGVNEMVRLLYPEIADKYELLHSWSCEVRYGNGLTVGTIADARGIADEILSALNDRSLL